MRLNFQQRSNPNIPRSVCVACLLYALVSTAAKLLFTFTGTFVILRIHSANLFLLFLDHLGVVAWYWWLSSSATNTRKLLQYISVHLSLMTTLLLAVAIFGTVSKLWISASEVHLPHLTERERY